MPQLPRLTDAAPVSERSSQFVPIRDVSRPDSFGGGPALDKVMSSAAKVYEIQKQNGDQMAILEADKNLSALETRLLYDPETGAMNKKGKQAFGAVESTDEAFQKGITEIENSLSNDTQRASFRKLALTRQADISRSMNKHVSQEIQKYDLQETEAYIQTERSAVMQNPFDSERIEAALYRQQVAVATYAQRNGLPDEVAKKSLLEVHSKTHANVLTAMLASDAPNADSAAQDYFKTHKDSLVGDDKIRMQKEVEEGTLRGESQRKADDIFSTSKSLSEAIAKTKEIEDSKLRDATADRVKQNFQIKEASDRDRDEKLITSFGNMIDKGEDPRGKPGWANLSPSQKTQLDTYFKHRTAGTEPATDWNVYTQLKLAASDPEQRDQFAKADLFTQFRNKLDDAKYTEIVSIQAGLRNGDSKTKEVMDGWRTDQMVVNDALISAGLDLNDDDDKEKAAGFRRLVDEQVISYQSATGKKINNKELQEIVDNMMVKVVTDRGFFMNTTKPAWQLTPEDQIEDVDISDVPRAEQSKIRDYLKRAGKPDSDTSIVELYKLKLNSMRKK